MSRTIFHCAKEEHFYRINIGGMLKLDPNAILVEEFSSFMDNAAQLSPSAVYPAASVCLGVAEEDVGIVFPSFFSFFNIISYTPFFKYLLQDGVDLDFPTIRPGECLLLSLADLLCPSQAPLRRLSVNQLQFFELSVQTVGMWKDPRQLFETRPSSVVNGRYCLNIFNSSSAIPAAGEESYLAGDSGHDITASESNHNSCCDETLDEVATPDNPVRRFINARHDPEALIVDLTERSDRQPHEPKLVVGTNPVGCEHTSSSSGIPPRKTDGSIGKKRPPRDDDPAVGSSTQGLPIKNTRTSSLVNLPELSDPNILPLLEQIRAPKPVGFIPIFKFLRAYHNWYYDDQHSLHSTFYRPHCRGVPKETLVQGQDYFIGEEEALRWLEQQHLQRIIKIDGKELRDQQQGRGNIAGANAASSSRSALSDAVIAIANQVTARQPAISNADDDSEAAGSGESLDEETKEFGWRAETRRRRAEKAAIEPISMPLTLDPLLEVDLQRMMRQFKNSLLYLPVGDKPNSFEAMWRFLKKINNNWRMFFSTAGGSRKEVYTRTFGCTAQNYHRPCYRMWEDYFIGRKALIKHVAHQANLVQPDLGAHLCLVFNLRQQRKTGDSGEMKMGVAGQLGESHSRSDMLDTDAEDTKQSIYASDPGLFEDTDDRDDVSIVSAK